MAASRQHPASYFLATFVTLLLIWTAAQATPINYKPISSYTPACSTNQPEDCVTQGPKANEEHRPCNPGDHCRGRKLLTESIKDRCEVEPGEKRGVVKYVGRAEALGPGFWVRALLDEPLGKHDGMVKGTRYFQCPTLCGLMVRPDKVKVGDYQERDPFEEDEIRRLLLHFYFHAVSITL